MDKENRDLNESIDIFKIINKIRNLFKSSFHRIIIYKVRILIFMILFASIGVMIYFISPTFYQAEMIVGNHLIKNETCEAIIESLQENHQPSYLSKNKKGAIQFENKLKIPHDDAMNIRSITYQSFNENNRVVYKDSVVEIYPFKVQIQTYDSTLIGRLGQSIIEYLKNSPYIESKLGNNLSYYKNNLSDIEAKLKMLDSIQMIMLNKNFGVDAQLSNNGLTINALDPTKITSIEIELFREKEGYIQKIKSIENAFPVIKPMYSIGNTKGNTSIIFLAIYGMLIGFVLGIFSIYLIPNNKN